MHSQFDTSVGVQPILSSLHSFLSTIQGGRIAVDATLISFWQGADAHTIAEMERGWHLPEASPLSIRSAHACLAEAGLLLREDGTHSHTAVSRVVGDLVSAIVVGHNSLPWLSDCLASLSTQSHSPLELIFVDNASIDGSADWLASHFPHIKILRLTSRQSLAHAINQGIIAATGKYFLILNPDVRLESDAIAQMVDVAQSDPSSAAVAAKLKFMWASAFLNGIGNHVGAFSWGTDNGLGHLDLGQFDNWREVPSACFAAALVSRSVWEKVGKLDENFPLYYEDNEWCYRARLMGYTIRAAPQAVVYHAFGSRTPTGDETRMNADKLQNVVYGRLRFAIKILTPVFLLRFLLAYAFEDGFGFLFAVLRLDGAAVRAYWTGWSNLIHCLPALLSDRRNLQPQRTRTDRELFDWQNQIPAPFIWHGLPELTWDLVQNHYLPLILSGKTRPLPEFADIPLAEMQTRPSRWSRARSIWRNEGGRALLHRIGRYVQWRLARV